ncbi:MAG: hypothetical protein Q8P22_06845 [Chloroflexota bacterium]|nr:hypothetical protein [Chloroflexota bacterium]
MDLTQDAVIIVHLKALVRIGCPQCQARLGCFHGFCPRCGAGVKGAVARQQ